METTLTINYQDIERAIDMANEEGIPKQRGAHSYYLVYEGAIYPPQYIYHLAAAMIQEKDLGEISFSATNCRKELQKLGFTIWEKEVYLNVIDQLEIFGGIADEWYAENTWFLERYHYYQNFFKLEFLNEANWEDFQELGNNIHAFQSMAIAKNKALGNPNHPIDHYRKAFAYLKHGHEDIAQRVNAFVDKNHSMYLKNFGWSTVSELAGYAFPEDYVFWNERDKKAVELLGIETVYKRGSSLGDRFIEFNKQIKEVISLYDRIVGKRTETTIPLEVDQFFSWIYKNRKEDESLLSKVEEEQENYRERNYWKFALGTKAAQWKNFYKNGIVAISYQEKQLSSLEAYETIEDLGDKMGIDNPHNSNVVSGVISFRDAAIGDLLFVSKGVNTCVGIGILAGEYYHDEGDKKFAHKRKVNWIINQKLDFSPYLHEINYKALFRWDTFSRTNQKDFILSKYAELFPELKKIFREENIHFNYTNKKESQVNHWWLNASPSIWSISNFEVGQEQTYTTHNENGNKRRIYKYMQALKAGDLLIGYESHPVKKVKAILEITKGIHKDENDQECFAFKLKEFLPNELAWNDLSTKEDLDACEVFNNNQGSLFRLTKDEYDFIYRQSKLEYADYLEAYDLDKVLEEVFLDEKALGNIKRALEHKKNIILQGPPGTGKTFLARRLAYAMMGKKDHARLDMIQFHQSYAYEDFIQGYRPNEDGKFELANGIFYRFCRKAQSDPERKYFFIIDEINRGNLSKIFGELMMLIEHDKRGEEFAIPLTYSKDGNQFFIPENLYLIGTMNTADRSLAMVDYALRRRFAFIDLLPNFNDKFQAYLQEKKVDSDLIAKIIVKMKSLNESIEKASDLGKGFMVGHSYFCNIPDEVDEDWYEHIIHTEIAPLLAEYWFDKPEKVQQEINKLSN